MTTPTVQNSPNLFSEATRSPLGRVVTYGLKQVISLPPLIAKDL